MYDVARPTARRLLCLAVLALATAPSACASTPGSAAAPGPLPAATAEPAPPTRAQRVRVYRAWHGMSIDRFRVTEPIFAQRIASLEQRSVFARARLEAIRRSGMRVWVTTPQALRRIAPRAPHLPVAWVMLLEGGRDVVAIVDLEWLRGQHESDGAFSEDDFHRDLDVILGHELFVHIGSIGPGRRIADICRDPDPVPGALGCSVVQENLFTHSLDATAPFRDEYRTLVLRTEARGDSAAARLRAVSASFPELDERGWETTSYARFVTHHRLDIDTPFQRLARMLWENGERDRVETGYSRLIVGIRNGRAQAQLEAELLPALAAPRPAPAADRFRIRELALVRAGKHAHARAMSRRRLEVLNQRPELSLDAASAIVIGEMETVSLEPETFEEAIEALHRHGRHARIREAYDHYLARLAAGQPERDVREAGFRELLPEVLALRQELGASDADPTGP